MYWYIVYFQKYQYIYICEGEDQPPHLDSVQTPAVRETVFSSEICSVDTDKAEQGATILFDDIGKIIFWLAPSMTTDWGLLKVFWYFVLNF